MMLQSQNIWNTEMSTLTDVNKLILTDLKISNFTIVGLPQLDHLFLNDLYILFCSVIKLGPVLLLIILLQLFLVLVLSLYVYKRRFMYKYYFFCNLFASQNLSIWIWLKIYKGTIQTEKKPMKLKRGSQEGDFQ